MSSTVRCLYGAVGALGVAWSGLGVAHHSFAAFDRTRTMAVSGTAKSWEWTNPHVWMTLTVTGKDGVPIDYRFEGFSPIVFHQMGLSRNIVKVGDKVSVTYYPNKDASAGGQLETINGAAMMSDNPPGRAGGAGQ